MDEQKIYQIAGACGLDVDGFHARRALVKFAENIASGSAPASSEMLASDESRAAFEAHFGLTLRQALRTQDGSAYQMSNIQDKWEGWQAAKGEGK